MSYDQWKSDMRERKRSRLPDKPIVDHDTRVQIRSLLARGWPIQRIVVETGLPIKTVEYIRDSDEMKGR